MALPLEGPFTQFVDADGHPYAGGTVSTFVPGTDTPKDTWTDEAGTVLNTNPVVLDAAGRAVILGDGDYRLIIRDVNGLLVWDGWATSIVSDAMQPVVSAPTIADAVALLGIADMISAETTRAETAENALQTAITSETTRATNAENTLTTDLNNEISRAEAAEADLQSQITALESSTLKSGGSATDSSGHVRVTYSSPFPTNTTAVVVTNGSSGLTATWPSVQFDRYGFDCWMSIPLAGDTLNPAAAGFYWMATGY